MTDSNDRGRFVWYDLMTPDPKAAVAFYTQALGWTTETWDTSGSPYTMWHTSQGNMGGVMELPEPARKMGAPPHWMGYVAVPSVDATVAVARSLGGNVYVQPMDIPNVGRFAVIADPQGASIAVFQSSDPMRAHDRSKSGEFNWHELIADDAAVALAFYRELFGWEPLGDFDMGPMGTYRLFGRNGVQMGGMFSKTADMPMPACWLYYVFVTDLDGTIARCKAAGGRLLMGPQDIPGGGRIAQLADPQGATFALVTGPTA